ncbi:MAG: hypothetical protein IIZ40_04420 [Bacilli bacterium]|nr:hypothetical protein [Bacilli bacterium]
MNYFKMFIIISFTIILGMFLGTYIYKASKLETENTFKEETSVYMLQYGVYSSIQSMKDSTVNLSDYFFFKDNDGYHAIIGIVINKNLSDKIRDSYNIKDNIYIKEVKVSNMEFIENLKQYDLLVESLNDNNAILSAEKQILSKYEELVLNNE